MPSFAKNRITTRMRRYLQSPRKNAYIHQVLARIFNSPRIVELLVCEGILKWRKNKLAVITDDQEIRWAQMGEPADFTAEDRALDAEQYKLASTVLYLQMYTIHLERILSQKRIGV